MSTTLAAGTATSGAALSSDTSGILQLQSGSTPTTAVTIDTAQNVGVGVTPSSWYTTSNTHAIQLPNSALLDYQGTSANYAQNAYLNTSGNWIYKTTAAATQYQQTGGAHYWYNVGSGTAGNTISFNQAMTLDNNGTLLIGTTSSRGGCYMTLSSSQWALGPSVGSPTLFFIAATNSTGVYLNGTSATSWSSNSDERLKTDLVPIANGLEKVNTLRAVTGRYKTDATGTSRAFLIAQDVQAVLPEAVGTIQIPESEDKTEYLSLAYQELIPLLVASIKELSAEVTALKAKVGA